jgi:2-C-methyl-D-erythritol 4-phosphate cytidylyltransferase
MSKTRRNIAIILASGTGTRFHSETPKQFLKLAGKTVLEHTLDTFERHSRIDETIVVAAFESRLLVEEIVNNAGYRKVTRIVAGGTTRQASSAAGIDAVIGDDHKVLVHDAVRPLLDHATIDRCLDALDECDAVDTGIPASDTIIQLSSNYTIANIPERSMLRLGQTPQGFKSGLLRQGHTYANNDKELKVTDDCGLILHYGLGEVKVVAGDINNIKITYPSDIYLADRLFQLRARQLIAQDIDNSLRNKVVAVFGASRGIGEQVAAIAEKRGAIVRSASRHHGVDVADAQTVRNMLIGALRTHGRLDIVINTAGVLYTGLLAGQEYETIDEQIRTNLRGSVVVAREAFALMQQSGGSIILFTSSSYTRGRARSSVYSATKAAVVNLVQGLAQEYSPFGVRINAVNPERTATPMRAENFGHEPTSDLLTAETVALAALSVALSEASGEVIDVRR